MIYYIRQGDSGPIKIGFSEKSPATRRKQLQTGNPEKLKIICVTPGSEIVETCLHDMFKDLHIRGEWFRSEKILLNYIEKRKRP